MTNIYTPQEQQLLKHYADYTDQMRTCKTGEQRDNLKLMWEMIFRTEGTTLEDVQALPGRPWLVLVKMAFAACFEEPQDRTFFELAHTPKIQSNEHCSHLIVDGGQSHLDRPGSVHASAHCVIFAWRQQATGRTGLVLHRDIDCGPAEVTVFGDGSFRGYHFSNGI